jgi:hypothetical protein
MIDPKSIEALRTALTKLRRDKAAGASYLEIGAQYEALGKLFAPIGREILDTFCETQILPIHDLRSQLSALDRMISQTPAENVIDRQSLEDRKQEVTKELENLRGPI